MIEILRDENGSTFQYGLQQDDEVAPDRTEGTVRADISGGLRWLMM